MKSYVKQKDLCQGKRLTYQKIQDKKLFYNYLCNDRVYRNGGTDALKAAIVFRAAQPRCIKSQREILLKDAMMTKAKNVQEYIARQRAAIAGNPECGTSHYNLAVALLGLKQYDEAEKELKEAIYCSPNLAEGYVQLGGICLQRGDLDGCMSYNQQSIKVRAGFAEGWGNIGFVHLQKGEVDEAIHALRKAITFNVNFLQAYATLANAYLMKGLIDESIEANLKTLELEPGFAVAHNNLAIAYLEQSKYDQAIEHFDKAVALGYEVAPEMLKEVEPYRDKAD